MNDDILKQAENEVPAEAAPLFGDSAPMATPTPNLTTGPEINGTKPAGKKKLKKSLIIGIVVAAVLVIGTTAAVLGYFLWYQNPEKVVFDSITNAIKAKSIKATGELKLKVNDNSDSAGIKSATLTLIEKGNIASYDVGAKLTVDIANHDKPLNLEGGAIMTEGGDIYLRVSGVKKVIDSYLENMKTEADVSTYEAIYASVKSIVEMVDGQWWKISAAELSEQNKDYGEAQKCVTGVAKKLESDDSMRGELADLYGKNRFIVIKESLGEKDGNLGYKVDGDGKAAKKFVKGLKNTKVYKELHDCNDSFTIDESSLGDDSNSNSDDVKVSTELWISKFGHELVEVKASVSDDGTRVTGSLKPVFNKSSEVKAPSGSKSIKELIEAVQKLVTGATGDGGEQVPTGSFQQNQRDTERKDEVSIVGSALTNYQANNRGSFPDPTTINVADLANNPVFAVYMKELNGAIVKTVVILDGSGAAFTTASGATVDKIVIATGAMCDPGDAQNGKYIKADSARDAAIIIKLESNIYYCQDI
ncbi:MAG: hypothetical protein LBG75_01895 [Candidatus Nomurabacteria bacterium]|jgi:hypothetical protein|nr:hypothetical protein [Candidatus Nomurabacteria bacterium]